MKKKKIYSSNDLRLRELSEKVDSRGHIRIQRSNLYVNRRTVL